MKLINRLFKWFYNPQKSDDFYLSKIKINEINRNRRIYINDSSFMSRSKFKRIAKKYYK